MYRQWTTQSTTSDSTTHFGWAYDTGAIKITGNTASGSTTVTGVSSFTGLAVGMLITDYRGTGAIPSCMLISSLNPASGTLTMNKAANSTKSALQIGQSNSIGCEPDGNHVPSTVGATWSNIPVPSGVQAATGSDSHAIIWDTTNGIDYEFWRWAERNPKASGGQYISPNNADPPWNIYAGGTQTAPTPPNAAFNAWDGGMTYTNDANHYGVNVPTRASYNPGLAGLVRPWELAQGHIDHALSFAYATPGSDPFVYPAEYGDGGNSAGLPYGTRVQLKPDISDSTIQNTWGCVKACFTIAKALQTYGMYLTDAGGSSKIYLEEDSTANWSQYYSALGVTSIAAIRDIPSKITGGNSWSNFRVVKPPCDPGTTTCPTGTTDTQAPSVPGTITAGTTISSSISLSWVASTDNVGVTGYKIYRNGTQVGTSTTTTYTDSGLTASTSYSYTISAYDAAGNNSAQNTAKAISTAATTPTCTPATNLGNINCDSKIDIYDLSILLSNYNKAPAQTSYPQADLNGNNLIDIYDLSILLTNYPPGP